MCFFTSTSKELPITSPEGQKSTSEGTKPSIAPECFNGDVLENYMWSQTGSEVDVRVPVPSSVSGKDVTVEIKNNSLKVALKNTHKEGNHV